MGKKGQIQSYSGTTKEAGWTGLLVYLVAVVLLAAVLGPLVYWVIDSSWHQPFSRVMNRILLTSAVICLGPWLRGHLPELGLGFAPGRLKLMAQGAGLGILCLGLVCFAQSLNGFTIHFARPSPSHFLLLALGAMAVALVEETLFRGAAQSFLMQRLGGYGGWIAAAALFAMAHFIHAPDTFDPQPVRFWDGLFVWNAIGHSSSLNHGTAIACLSLLLLGLILGLLYIRSKSLWTSAFFHFVVIITLKLSILGQKQAYLGLPLSNADLLSSGLTPPLLLLITIGLWRFYHPISPGNGRAPCSI